MRPSHRIGSRAMIAAAAIAMLAPAALAAGAGERGGPHDGHRARHHDGHRAPAGILRIGRHTCEIDDYGSIHHAIADAFSKAGFPARIHGGGIRVDLGRRCPEVRWRSGTHGVRIEQRGRYVTLYPYEIRTKYCPRNGCRNKRPCDVHGRHAKGRDKLPYGVHGPHAKPGRDDHHDQKRAHKPRRERRVAAGFRIRIGGDDGFGFRYSDKRFDRRRSKPKPWRGRRYRRPLRSCR